MVAGTEMPLYVMGLAEQESPFTFGTALPATQFKWTVSNDKVASLYNLYSPIGLQETNENNFRVGLKAHQDGLVTVHVEVTLPKESSITFFGNQQVLSSDIQIQVFKKLKLTNPEVEGDIILLSLNSQLKLKCNRFGPAKVTYEILPPVGRMVSTLVASVDKDGNLIASSKTGSAILLVKAVEEFGVIQELSVIVKVEEIAYMMVRPIEGIQTKDWPLSSLPVGFTISFAISYHDNIGLQFDAVRSQLKFRASRHNLARVSFGSTNATLTAQVVKPGHTVLKVWDVEASIPPDYIRIVTGSAIDPSDVQLTVGDVICFGSPLLTKEGHGGTWMSSKPVLSIHPVSGGAIALASGTTSVTYSLLNGYSTSTEVFIQDAAYISIVPGSINHICNFPRAKPYKIPIIIQSNDTHRTSNIIGRNCSYATENSMPLPQVQPPFNCELNFIGNSVDISINDIFFSTGGFDMEKGMYFCSIEPVNKISMSETSALEGQLSLSVHLFSMDHSSSLSQQHLLTFLPAFYVQQQELVFSDFQLSVQVIITATPAVQRCIMIVPSDQSILHVKSAVSNPIYPGAISFIIELQSRNNLWRAEQVPLHIDISCPITKQQVQLPVKVKRLDSTVDSSSYCAPPPLTQVTYESKYDWFFLLTVLTAVAICLVCLYVFRWFTSSRRGVVTTQPVFLHSSNGSQHFSPGRSPYTSQSVSFSPRYSPTPEEVDNLSGPLRLCTLDTSPKTLRRRSDNIFR